MKFWVEIHCEATEAMKRAAAFARHEYDGNICETETGDQPGAMARNINNAVRAAKSQAKERGWRMVKGVGFCCRVCAAQSNVSSE